MLKQLLALATLLACCNTVFGLYFHITETGRKCFIEEVPYKTTVIVQYKVELYAPHSNGLMPSSPGIGMHFEVLDSDNKIILSRVYSSKGRISFTSHTPGEHVMCMYSNSTAWFSGAQLRVHLDIQVGEHAIDYASVAQKEKLTELQLRIRQLLDQVDQITKEQNYQRYRKKRFRQTSECTNSRVLWWCLSQTVVLVCMGFWQMRHLKTFEAKKFLKMHYPSDTGTIMVLVRLMVMYQQSNNKAEFLEKLQSFQSLIVIKEQQVDHKLLGEKFEMFTTSDSFKSLIGLVGTNSQYVDTSVLAERVKKVLDLPMSDSERVNLNECIDDLYSKVGKFDGEFLNNEGSGLYLPI